MNTFFIILAVTGAAVAVWWLFFRFGKYKKIWKDLVGLGISKHLADFKYEYLTPQGARVTSTVKVPDHALALLDQGINNQIERHNRAYPSWDRYKSPSDYDILFITPMAVNVETEPGSPALLVQGIQTAGTCIGVQAHPAVDKSYIVLPHQEATGWSFRDYLMRSAWNESEHVREWQNDYRIFDQYTGANDVHPHVP